MYYRHPELVSGSQDHEMLKQVQHDVRVRTSLTRYSLRINILKFINVFINGIKIPLAAKSTIKDIIRKFFSIEAEFIVCVNSKTIPYPEFNTYFLQNNDDLKVITYSEHSYKPNKRTIFKNENGEKQ